MQVVDNAASPREKAHLKPSRFIWWIFLHAGALLAPFYFTWSGLVLCIVLYLLAGFGVTMGYHRLLTHRSFQTPRFVEYILTFFGVIANQGAPIQWVAAHRVHHRHSDQEGDPHSPRDGGFWAHALWWMCENKYLDDMTEYSKYVTDLLKDPVHRFLNRFYIFIPIAFGGLLYVLGQWWDGVGMSWLLWGFFVRTALVYNATHFVNSAAHKWGYQSYKTRDQSKNLWWVAILSLGEGWHNNHHAFPRSAKHGLRWWEFDPTYLLIKCMSFVKMAKHIHLPGRILAPARTSTRAALEADRVAEEEAAATIADNQLVSSAS